MKTPRAIRQELKKRGKTYIDKWLSIDLPNYPASADDSRVTSDMKIYTVKCKHCGAELARFWNNEPRFTKSLCGFEYHYRYTQDVLKGCAGINVHPITHDVRFECGCENRVIPEYNPVTNGKFLEKKGKGVLRYTEIIINGRK